MPPNTPHPEYKSMIAQWRRCRDCLDGQDAVKARGALYLPMLEGQTASEYEAYKTRASFYGASTRTAQALTGLVFRNPPQVSDFDEELADHLGLEGEDLDSLMKQTTLEQVGMGRVGVLVDLDKEGEGDPYVALYRAEQIINWNTKMVRGKRILTMVMLHECKPEPKVDDPYTMESVEYYRELLLDNPDSKTEAAYRVRVWKEVRKVDPADKQEKVTYDLQSDDVAAIKGGKHLPYIPFCILNAANTGAKPQKPPLLDMVDVNLAHYRNSADLEHGLHFTALPTAWVAGFDPKAQGNLKIGSGTAWVTENVQARAEYLEFSGEGLKSITAAMAEKERQMSVLGARMLEASKRGTESAEALRLRSSGDAGVMATIVMTGQDAWNTILRWVLAWQNKEVPEDCMVELNPNLDLETMDSQTLMALQNAVDTGKISWETWFYNIQRAGFVPEGRDAETEMGLIKETPPTPGPGSGNQNPDQGNNLPPDKAGAGGTGE